MYDPAYLYDFIWLFAVGGMTGLITTMAGQGSGLGLIWDMAAGFLGAFMGASFSYYFNLLTQGFAEALGISILASVFLLVFLRILVRFLKISDKAS